MKQRDVAEAKMTLNERRLWLREALGKKAWSTKNLGRFSNGVHKKRGSLNLGKAKRKLQKTQ